MYTYTCTMYVCMSIQICILRMELSLEIFCRYTWVQQTQRCLTSATTAPLSTNLLSADARYETHSENNCVSRLFLHLRLPTSVQITRVHSFTCLYAKLEPGKSGALGAVQGPSIAIVTSGGGRLQSSQVGLRGS